MSARKHPDKMPVASLWWLPVFLSRYELFISSNVVKRSVIAAQFLRCRRRSSLVTAVRFSNGQEAFPLTTAAQNVCALRQKLPLRRNHFFEWSKTAVLLFDCGTSTLKSPLLRAFFTPHVHSRLRKRLSRCTLDCGFKTSESPALRGFVAERGPITGTSLYLVLKSNGLPRPKIRLKKFGFSLKIVPANIVRKLPSQRCFKPLFIASFNFSHKRRNVRFKGLRRVHTRLCSKNRTQRHTRRNRGPSLPRPQRGLVLPAISLLFHHAFIYIHFPVHCEPPLSAERKIRRNCRHKLYPQPFLIPVFNFSHKRPTFAFTPESGYTLGLRRKIAHKRLHAETRGVSDGVLLLPSDCFTRFGKPAWPGGRTANCAAFGSWPGALSKNAEGLRDSDALMRVAVPQASRPRWAA